jgi:hypothetical protein
MLVTKVEEVFEKEIEISYNNSMNIILKGRVKDVTPLIYPEDSPILTVEHSDGTVVYFPFNSLFQYKVVPFSPSIVSPLNEMFGNEQKLIHKLTSNEIPSASHLVGKQVVISKYNGHIISLKGKVLFVIPAGEIPTYRRLNSCVINPLLNKSTFILVHMSTRPFERVCIEKADGLQCIVSNGGSHQFKIAEIN